jgi:hypothetical protein
MPNSLWITTLQSTLPICYRVLHGFQVIPGRPVSRAALDTGLRRYDKVTGGLRHHSSDCGVTTFTGNPAADFAADAAKRNNELSQ